MLESSQPWNLFGYDLRRAVHYFRAGWSDFLWGDQSPVLGAIDEVLEAHTATGEVRYYRSGAPIAEPVEKSEVTARAIILPEHLVLSKQLRVPAAAEAELEAVAALEVSSSSPFPESDTCYGSLISRRGEHDLDVELVISSQGAVMAHIAEQFDSHDVQAFEVWAQVANRMVLIAGFGEAGRRARNRRRLGRMATLGAYCLAAILAFFAFAAGWKYLELQKVQSIHDRVERSAGNALELREQLASAKALISTTNELLMQHPSPLTELQRLTDILGDETTLQLAEVEGLKIKLEGESSDAAAVMQLLLDQSAYQRVQAPVAIKKQRSGMERFVLDLTLQDGGGSR